MQDILKVLVPIIVTHVIVLAVIILIMKKLLLGDTVKAMDRIRQVESEVRKKEEDLRREIEEHEKELAAKQAEAEETLQRRREESEKESVQLRDKILAEAKISGDRILDQARRNEEKLRQQIVQDMDQKAVDYGARIFQLVMSDKMNAELNKQFIDEVLDAIEEVDSTSITVDASQSEFKTSHPLKVEQRIRLERLLKEKFDVSIRVEEQVDEKLLAGLRFKLGSLEIDGTLLNRFEEAVEEVRKATA